MTTQTTIKPIEVHIKFIRDLLEDLAWNDVGNIERLEALKSLRAIEDAFDAIKREADRVVGGYEKLVSLVENVRSTFVPQVKP